MKYCKKCDTLNGESAKKCYSCGCPDFIVKTPKYSDLGEDKIRKENHVVCSRCNSELIINQHEKSAGEYVCPECKEKRKIDYVYDVNIYPRLDTPTSQAIKGSFSLAIVGLFFLGIVLGPIALILSIRTLSGEGFKKTNTGFNGIKKSTGTVLLIITIILSVILTFRLVLVLYYYLRYR